MMRPEDLIPTADDLALHPITMVDPANTIVTGKRAARIALIPPPPLLLVNLPSASGMTHTETKRTTMLGLKHTEVPKRPS